MGECKFAHGNCITHPTLVDGDKVLEGSPPALCTHAATDLERQFKEQKALTENAWKVANDQATQREDLERRVEAFEQLQQAVSVLSANIARLEEEKANKQLLVAKDGLHKAALELRQAEAALEERTQAAEDYMLGAQKHWRRIQELEAAAVALREAVGRTCQDMTDWLSAERQLPLSQAGGAEAIAPWLEELSEALSPDAGRAPADEVK